MALYYSFMTSTIPELTLIMEFGFVLDYKSK